MDKFETTTPFFFTSNYPTYYVHIHCTYICTYVYKSYAHMLFQLSYFLFPHLSVFIFRAFTLLSLHSAGGIHCEKWKKFESKMKISGMNKNLQTRELFLDKLVLVSLFLSPSVWCILYEGGPAEWEGVRWWPSPLAR